MAKTVKIAISLPIKEFQEIESIKKKENLSRSEIILEAIRQWKEARKMKKLVRQYEEGYSRIPEALDNAEAWEKASLASFSRKPLQ